MVSAEHFRRQWGLYQLLARDVGGRTLQELASELDVSMKTVQRDLATLRAVGIPVVETVEAHGRKRWRVPPDVTRVPQLLFDEAAAIYLGRRFMEPLAGTGFWEAAQRAFAKLKAMFQPHTLEYLEQLASAFHQTAIGASNYTERAEAIDLLMTAVEDHRVTQIVYASAKSESPKTYQIHPLGFVYHEGSLYLVAHSVEANELRHFKADRLHEVELTTERFTMPDGFTLAAHLSGSFGVYHTDQPLQRVRIRFDASTARYLEEHRWHASQSMTRNEDGSVVIELMLSDLTEVRAWVLSFGEKVEVLEPAELREGVILAMSRCLKRYDATATHTHRGAE